jgi:energy-coupling factor transporter ATP-binding protein EcfA2
VGSNEAAMIQVRDVQYLYEGNPVPALDHVSLNIDRGEFVAFVGQNGAGKTTLAKTFNGILVPTSGEVIVEGRESRAAGLDVLARIVGYCYQNPDHQIFANTVKDEVSFGPRNLGMSAADVAQATQHALELVGMQKDADSYPFLLGRGQRQKVAVASVIAMGSPVLVVDEPTTGLDLQGSLSIMDLLRRWNADGRTIIIITHDMNIVAEYAQRTVVMAQGRILADGPTRRVLVEQEMLAKAFLKAPQVTRVAQSLNGRFGFPRDVLTVKEFYAELKKRLKTREEVTNASRV